jgi:hypothetical protein
MKKDVNGQKNISLVSVSLFFLAETQARIQNKIGICKHLKINKHGGKAEK